MSKIITVLVEVVIFTSLIAVIAAAATDAKANLSGAAKTLVGLGESRLWKYSTLRQG